ncbi:hypothetical protein EJG51_000480 [Undibacterium piscinae]|uniref:Uncharacterized protein n=1 Tax=Undibacterium piscinae TaxID=2495591 RepID=A0A6M3ZZN8_9BURK|nr:hypothetical protein EJG51_000480 [Undibacterium piscinae]
MDIGRGLQRRHQWWQSLWVFTQYPSNPNKPRERSSEAASSGRQFRPLMMLNFDAFLGLTNGSNREESKGGALVKNDARIPQESGAILTFGAGAVKSTRSVF